MEIDNTNSIESNSLLKAEYVSCWEEGTVNSSCEIDTDDGEIINIETVDCDYEFYLSEHVEVVIGGKKIELAADHGELTQEGMDDLKAALKA